MKKIILMTVAAIMMTVAANAQKIGHLAYEEVMKMMPEYVAAEKTMKEQQEAYMTQLQQMNKELEDKMKKYQAEAPKMTQAMKEVTEKELTSLNQRLQEKASQADAELGKKQEELLKPIIEKLRVAVQAVGTKNGYDYILESTTLHFSKDALNVTNLVKAELGIK